MPVKDEQPQQTSCVKLGKIGILFRDTQKEQLRFSTIGREGIVINDGQLSHQSDVNFVKEEGIAVIH